MVNDFDIKEKISYCSGRDRISCFNKPSFVGVFSPWRMEGICNKISDNGHEEHSRKLISSMVGLPAVLILIYFILWKKQAKTYNCLELDVF